MEKPAFEKQLTKAEQAVLEHVPEYYGFETAEKIASEAGYSAGYTKKIRS